jgi:5'-methylthioadenosine phosphorylase
MTIQPYLGIIGGSGVYDMDQLQDQAVVDIDTPYGKPSSPITIGTINSTRVAFLARHGLGHFILPGEVNYRANIIALKMLGVKKIVSISAVGSLREDYAPGDIVVPDQLFDFTRDHRPMSFFGEGLVGHVSVAEPYCNQLSDQVYEAVKSVGASVKKGGTLITIEGPRFSTKAESNVFRSWGMSLIGMTACPEAFLAKEAELCYATMAHVTDYDVWHESEEPVTVEKVIATLRQNTAFAQDAITKLAAIIDTQHNCQGAIKDAIMTTPSVIPVETRRRMDAIVKNYLD